MEKYIIITAGRGPIECSLAVYGIQKKFINYLVNNNIPYEIIDCTFGKHKKTINTIVIKCLINDNNLSSWIGTIQWICQSPIRKSHKRKNWFIKCEAFDIGDKYELDSSEVIVQTFRASGPGGQHRNKVETAVRLIHKSSGISVSVSDGKSQHQNKKKAWEKLNQIIIERNNTIIKEHNYEQWISQINIERGNPIKVFRGLLFNELL